MICDFKEIENQRLPNPIATVHEYGERMVGNLIVFMKLTKWREGFSFCRENSCMWMLFAFLALLLQGCTSIGHEQRAEPQIERKLATRPNEIAVTGSGELSTAIELLLVSRGVTVKASPVQVAVDGNQKVKASEITTRYVANVNSVDHDTCVPEGSRQMHFHISVVDLVNNERVFAMSGDYGCKNTIVRRFERWFFQ